MTRKRNPGARNNLVAARVDDHSVKEIAEIAQKTGKSKSWIIWKAIKAGLPVVKKEKPT